MIIEVPGPTYFSGNDEIAMFEWLGRIKVVRSVTGRGRSLLIDLQRTPTDNQLRDLLALFHRYRMDMTPLATLLTHRNRVWFASRDAYWFAEVFNQAAMPHDQDN